VINARCQFSYLGEFFIIRERFVASGPHYVWQFMGCVALLVGWPKAQLCFLYKWAPFLVKLIPYPHPPYCLSSLTYPVFEV